MKKIILFILLFLGLGNLVWAQGEWTLATDKDDIKVYTKTVPDSKIKAIKVVGIFNAAPSQLVALLMDVNNSAAWMYHTKSSTLIKQVSALELYYYSEVNMPWPIQNRDFVAHLIVSQNPQTKVISIEGPTVPGMVPQKSGVVRIKEATGRWTITPLENGQIKTEYILHVDPAGTLPSWLVNLFAAEGPVKIFKAIKVQLQKPAYKGNVLAFASE
ncbi:MAG TPA: START domain-containing protein [Mucilaginibacter sp.]|jgi:hypothetical protein